MSPDEVRELNNMRERALALADTLAVMPTQHLTGEAAAELIREAVLGLDMLAEPCERWTDGHEHHGPKIFPSCSVSDAAD
jgi:hypothetical protein